MLKNIKQNQKSNMASLANMVNCLSEDDLAALAGVKHSTLKAWRKRGQGPEYILIGRNYLYPIPAIERHLTSLIKFRNVIDPKTVLLN